MLSNSSLNTIFPPTCSDNYDVSLYQFNKELDQIRTCLRLPQAAARSVARSGTATSSTNQHRHKG
jgi:hypothetical protein